MNQFHHRHGCECLQECRTSVISTGQHIMCEDIKASRPTPPHHNIPEYSTSPSRFYRNDFHRLSFVESRDYALHDDRSVPSHPSPPYLSPTPIVLIVTIPALIPSSHIYSLSRYSLYASPWVRSCCWLCERCHESHSAIAFHYTQSSHEAAIIQDKSSLYGASCTSRNAVWIS